jgi:hypothetical protein
LAERRSKRHTKHVGERQSREHKRDRLRPFSGRHDIGRNDRAEAEEGAVGKCGHNPRAHEQPIARSDRAQAVPDNKDSDQQQQCPTAIETGGGDREDGRTEGHAQRIGGD